jgi:hypothetical protein
VSEREAVCPGFRRMSSFWVTNHAEWFLYCGASLKSACIEGVLLHILFMYWGTGEHRDLGLLFWMGLCINESGLFLKVLL